MSRDGVFSEGVLRVDDNGYLLMHVPILRTNWKECRGFADRPRCAQRRMHEQALEVWCPSPLPVDVMLSLDGQRALVPRHCVRRNGWVSLPQLILLPGHS